ncbi:unnamed protein product [Rotaria sp. Silwood2]|nr:unnamed protein product [Rotaria sp. Silwood2]
MCTKLAKLFVESIDRVVQELGYCCGRQYAYLPKLMLCYGKQQCWEIPSYGCYYYYYSNSEPSRFNLSSGKYTFCANCFHSIKSESILIGDDPTQTLVEIPKILFLLAKNDIQEPEIMIDCIVCTRLQQLPVTDLSSRLEEHVNQFLLDKYCHKSRVTIRVLYSSDKICEIKPQLKKCYLNQVADNNYPYRTKVILAFQEIESVDVVFFVHFFRPKLYRQDVYHEILIGYLDYAKQHGYMYAHIWACSASEGVNYIFRCRPPEQLLPKLKRLQDWCRKMLDNEIAERLVIDYKIKTIYKIFVY